MCVLWSSFFVVVVVVVAVVAVVVFSTLLLLSTSSSPPSSSLDILCICVYPLLPSLVACRRPFSSFFFSLSFLRCLFDAEWLESAVRSLVLAVRRRSFCHCGYHESCQVM